MPKAIYHACPNCDDPELKDVLKGKLVITKESTLFRAKLKCRSCSNVYDVELEQPADVEVPLVVSEGAESFKTKTYLQPETRVRVGDVIHDDDVPLKITSIEKEDKRLQEAFPKDITTIWAVKFDKVRVPVSINKGRKTISKTIEVPPDEVFIVGDRIELDRSWLAIHKIKTADRVLHVDQEAEAKDIVRIYAKKIKEKWA